MKLSLLTLSAFSLFAIGTFNACTTPAEKVENAETKVAEANKALDKANEEYTADIEKYRVENAAKVAANDKALAEFKIRIASEKKETREAYLKKIAELEKKDSDLKKRLADYKATGKDNWQIFKTEFSHDMDELGKAFKDLTVNNVKD